MDEIRKAIFEAMRNDLGVMAEHGDNEQSLYDEIMNADSEIIDIYRDTFLN